jgi:biofilm PGA synthesis N-glycosyltransferase PgaC
MLQFAVSLLVDNKYDKHLWLTYFWVIWYPVIYWVFNAMTVLVATPRGLTKKFGKAATWASPDRGLRAVTHDAQQNELPIIFVPHLDNRRAADAS